MAEPEAQEFSIPLLATLNKKGTFNVDQDFLDGRRPAAMMFGDFNVVATRDGVMLIISEETRDMIIKDKSLGIMTNLSGKEDDEVYKELERVATKFFPAPPVVL